MSAAPARSQYPVIRVDIQGIMKEKLHDHVVEGDVCNRIGTAYDSATEFSLPSQTREELGELAHNRKCRLRTCLVREDC
jgi:hypothetical protein